jgi:hypothetical protein
LKIGEGIAANGEGPLLVSRGGDGFGFQAAEGAFERLVAQMALALHLFVGKGGDLPIAERWRIDGTDL